MVKSVTKIITNEHSEMRKEYFDLRNIKGVTSLTNETNKNMLIISCPSFSMRIFCNTHWCENYLSADKTKIKNSPFNDMKILLSTV